MRAAEASPTDFGRTKSRSEDTGHASTSTLLERHVDDSSLDPPRSPSVTSHLASVLGHSRWFAQKIAYYSSPVAADDKVYIASAEGVVVVLDAGEELKVLARNQLDSPILATPALVDGKIYVRTEGHLYAFGN